VECGDSSPHGSESGVESLHTTFGRLNDDQSPTRVLLDRLTSQNSLRSMVLVQPIAKQGISHGKNGGADEHAHETPGQQAANDPGKDDQQG